MDVLKVCVVGDCKAGKTLLSRLLGGQPLPPGGYSPTEGLRIQEFTKRTGLIDQKIQIWDCSGNPKYKVYWKAMAKSLDGLILVYNLHEYEERNLEGFYSSFANGNNLTKWQCLIVGVSIGSSRIQDPGLQGKLKILNHGSLTLNPANIQSSVQEAQEYLDQLIQGEELKKANAFYGCPETLYCFNTV